MKNRVRKFLFVLICFLLPSSALFAEKYMGEVKQTKRYKSSTKDDTGERCRRAQGATELNINNVRARIGTGGNMWYDGSAARYYVPKDGNSTALYCAALWIGGTDETGQLRLAAMRFGQSGDDFWPGPLTNDSKAYTDAAVCNEYDRHFKINRAEVEAFLGMCDPETGAFVGDQNDVPDVIKNWPAQIKDKPGYSKYLAPFNDVNKDGEYNWLDGDYPYYDFDNALCPKTLKADLPPGGTYIPAPGYESRTDGDYMSGDLEPFAISGQMLVDQVLKGDQTLWWVFNDKGNTHTESKGEPIGLEIRAQAFAFSTNNEINNMTFYSYEIVNRSSYRLNQTYFSQWVDPDLGYSHDDYVGCDVERGLGYCYNGKLVDGPGTGAYTGIPPAVGIDFFQGPYMDPDGKDNPKIDIEKLRTSPHASRLELSVEQGGYAVYDENGNFSKIDTIRLTDDAALYKQYWYFKKGDTVGNCAINGVNFGNGIADDERFGMRRFVYYNNDSDERNGEPSKATDYYNYLRGYWRNNQRMTYGGPGFGQSEVYCDFMFPGNTDIWNWGTDGEPVDGIISGSQGWTEQTSGNSPGDRRFMQSAGPFTLEPGAVNYITVGIPWAKASSGDQYASVDLLKQVDDKCQALFDNCFKLVDGPDAPALTITPLSNELILYLSYENEQSNNYKEGYREIDNTIDRGYTETTYDSVPYFNTRPSGVIDTIIYENPNSETGKIDTIWKFITDTLWDIQPVERFVEYDRYFVFEGYQIYQLKDKTVSVSDIGDNTKAKLVAQCDVENYDPSTGIAIAKLVNFETDNDIGGLKGTVMVEGANAGIQHSFKITEDQFASGNNKTLVNNKEYYYLAVAYAYNNFKAYNQTDGTALDGQKEPYLRGRKNQFGGEIQRVVGIPADPSPRDGGTVVQSQYGDTPEITRIEGFGNGGLVLNLKQSAIEQVLNNGGNPVPVLEYERNAGPLEVRIVDPLNVVPGEYYIEFIMQDSIGDTPHSWNPDSAYWRLSRVDGGVLLTENGVDLYELTSERPINLPNEELILQLGFSIKITNPRPIATNLQHVSSGRTRNGGALLSGVFIGSSWTVANPASAWLQGVSDNDGRSEYNWIRAGSQYPSQDAVDYFTKSTSSPVTQEEITYFNDFLNQDYYVTLTRSQNTSSDSIPATMLGVDPDQQSEGILSGTWAPYKLVSYDLPHPGFSLRYYLGESVPVQYQTYRSALDPAENLALMNNDLNNLASTQIVFTADKSKWTRCPVLEMSDDFTASQDSARKFQIRKSPSIDKNGIMHGEPGCNEAEATLVSERGMGWFPGYAINLETGERLNIFYGEDSRFPEDNGADMMWNPTGRFEERISDSLTNYVIGGRHFIYVLGSNRLRFKNINPGSTGLGSEYYDSPAYDEGRWAYQMLKPLDIVATDSLLVEGNINGTPNRDRFKKDSAMLVFANVMWVNMPILNSSYSFNNPSDIPTDVTIKLHVRKPYHKNYNARGTGADPAQNDNNPLYMFKFEDDIATLKGVAGTNVLKSNALLDKLAVVPNPYYNRSDYELDDQIQTTIKITNLLAGSVVSIYSLDGTLVRRLDPCPPNQTYLTWDLLNHTGQLISGGMYLFHIKVPNVGDKVLRWFGSMRPVDINSYPMD